MGLFLAMAMGVNDAGKEVNLAEGSWFVRSAVAANVVFAQDADPQATPAAGENQPAQIDPDQLPLDWKTLKAKQEELERREQALEQLEKELDAKLEELGKMQADIKAMLEEAEVLQDKKIKHLVEVYSNMKAQQAANTLTNLNQDIAVKILAGMRGRQAGEILTYVEPAKAAKLSEALTRMQTPFGE